MPLATCLLQRSRLRLDIQIGHLLDRSDIRGVAIFIHKQLISGLFRPIPAYSVDRTIAAWRLKKLGMVRDTGFEPVTPTVSR